MLHPKCSCVVKMFIVMLASACNIDFLRVFFVKLRIVCDMKQLVNYRNRVFVSGEEMYIPTNLIKITAFQRL